MLTMNNNMNFDATSKIKDAEENDILLVTMNANISNGTIYINKTIFDMKSFSENKEVADADYAEFEAAILAKADIAE